MATSTDAAVAGVDPRAIRVRTGVLLIILADAMFVGSMLAGELYLGALNVSGQFKPPDEHAPSLVGSTVLTLIAVASALAYWWGARRSAMGNEAGFRMGAQVAIGLVVIALLGQIWFIASLDFKSPLHGYASMTILLSAYHGVHLLATATVGVLTWGRLTRGRLAGQAYIADTVGYWWYYVAVVAVAIWILGLITQG